MPNRPALLTKTQTRKLVNTGKQAGRVLYKGSRSVQGIQPTGVRQLDRTLDSTKVLAAAIEKVFKPKRKRK